MTVLLHYSCLARTPCEIWVLVTTDPKEISEHGGKGIVLWEDTDLDIAAGYRSDGVGSRWTFSPDAHHAAGPTGRKVVPLDEAPDYVAAALMKIVHTKGLTACPP